MSRELATGGETIKNPRQFSLQALLLLIAFYCVTFAVIPWLLEHDRRSLWLPWLLFAWLFPPLTVLNPRLLVGVLFVFLYANLLIEVLALCKLVEVTIQFNMLQEGVNFSMVSATLLALALSIRRQDLDSGFLQNSRIVYREVARSRFFVWNYYCLLTSFAIYGLCSYASKLAAW